MGTNDYINKTRVLQNGTSRSCNHLLLLDDGTSASAISEPWRLLVQFVTASVDNTWFGVINLIPKLTV
jgi:hypothetical protein